MAAGAMPGYLAPTAALVVAAAVIGYLSARAKVVPIVGFLAAGVLIGPSQLGVVDNSEAVAAAADIGVILLLFTIGIEFSLERLARVWTWIAVAGGLQLTLATSAGLGLTLLAGGHWRDGLFTGFLLALSSTAIVLKLLGERGETSGTRGQLALAVLIAQDLAVVGMVLVVPLLGSGEVGSDGGALLRALLTAVAVIAAILLLARRVMPGLLEVVARTCSPEVFLLSVVAVCLGTAYLTALAGVSVSLGAFLAGLVVSESRASTQAFAEILPLQILFSAVFFVSVGMLLDLGFVMRNLPLVLGAAAVVLVVKTGTTALAAAAVRIPLRTAGAAGLLLAQVGEFSFVLLTEGTATGLSPLGLGADGGQLVVATTVLLMLATPLLAVAGRRVDHAGAAPARAARGTGDRHDGGLHDHVVLIGWGATALDIAATLDRRDVPLVMITLSPEGDAQARAAGHRVVRGDPTKGEVLRAAGLPSARLAVVAEDDPEQMVRVVAAARPLTDAPILTRPLGEVDVPALAQAGADHILDRDRISGGALLDTVLGRLGHPAPGPPVSGTVVDTSGVVRYDWPPGSPCTHRAASRPVLPLAPGCVDCLRIGGTWVHLRICLSCGYVGCCDSSPNRHARGHADSANHPLVASVEPGETWAYCFVDDVTVPAPLADPPAPVRPAAGG